ncbi:ExbD/TolR family protein [Burkholderia ubonensis]|uniref:ExbD/TolR family protein n=1 Tax=Burkholderia ubonensis TaxID=101571 RepID=UPI0007588606|nr:biopolymer transporter ExbD [Burkholderia ubonensis]KVP47514.1 biopolymer transporter ExbD [Burkholderia ubonensis]KVQ86988.1 biopolymer transporter ExbD [Burkholderia ubonensis]KVR17371.1 biopolymer transporter ExbD [Burkholderia ubonensis]KWD41126.1 biopolymer transporter ExbD [Burkholderia ubonensis]KWD47777.1 biopolymer transporter ExbD [Burkholderia ubonensis]
MKLRRSRASKRGRIEIIPMIDVMFFLLATFMLTSLAMQHLDAVGIDLPRGQARQLQADRPVTLSVNRENQIFIDRQPVPLDRVSGIVAHLLGRHHDIVIAADDGAAHGVVVQAMLAARRAGAEHFLVAVHRD